MSWPRKAMAKKGMAANRMAKTLYSLVLLSQAKQSIGYDSQGDGKAKQSIASSGKGVEPTRMAKQRKGDKWHDCEWQGYGKALSGIGKQRHGNAMSHAAEQRLSKALDLISKATAKKSDAKKTNAQQCQGKATNRRETHSKGIDRNRTAMEKQGRATSAMLRH